MADRSVNININYKVNTADIQKAQAASKAAQTATDNLRKSASVYGTTAVKASNEAANSLKGVSDAAKKASSETGNLSTQFGNLYGAVKTFIAAGLVRELTASIINMAKLSGNVEGVGRAFQRNIPNANLLLAQLRKATHGTLNDFELMQRTLLATNLGVAAEGLPKIFEFVATRVQQTGQNLDVLLDKFIRGIGVKSPRLLDDLGISSIRLKEKLDGVALSAISIGDFTKVVGDIAQEELTKMGGYAVTSATKVDQLTASAQTLYQTLSQRITNNGGGFVVSFVNESLKALNKLFSKSSFADQSIFEQASEDVGRITDNLKGSAQERRDIIQQEINSRVQLLGSYNDNIKSLKAEREELKKTNPYADRIDAIAKTISAYNLNKKIIIETQEQLKKYLDTIKDTSLEEVDQTGIIQRKKEEIEHLNTQIEETNRLSDLGAKGTLIVKRDNAQKELDILEGKNKEIKKEDKSVSDYLAYLSELDLFQTTEILKERVAARKEAAKEEEKAEKEKQDKILADQKKAAEEAEKIEKHKQDLLKQAQQASIDGAIDLAASTANALVQIEADKYNRQINIVNDYYDNQIRLAGDNDKAKEQIERRREIALDKARRRAFEKNKEAQKIQAIINAAAAAARAFADYEYPVSIAIAALAGAEAAAQVAIISQQRANFKDGVINLKGPGTTTSDSIPANLSKGESVMTAKETFRAKGILEMIRGNKIDDRILKNLQLTGSGVKYVGMSDERIVSAIKDQTYPDVVRIGNDLFDVKRSKDGVSKSIRRKSMGNG